MEEVNDNINENANDNHSHLDSQAEASLGVEAVSPIVDINIPSQNFSDPILDSPEIVQSTQIVESELSIAGYKKGGRPKGSPNKVSELAPYHRKTRPVEDEELLKDIFTAVYQHGVQSEGHIIAALRIPRYQWLNLINKPNSRIREVIADAIEAYETKIKMKYAGVIEGESKWAMQFLSDEMKRINRKYGESDIVIQAASSTYESMNVDDLEKLALDHANKS